MKKFTLAAFMLLALCFAATAQDSSETKPATDPAAAKTDKPKRKVFRPTKGQITEVQEKFKADGSYAGEADGKMNDDFRKSIKTFQSANGLRQTGTLNRATLEKLNIELTDAQKEIPVSENSFASADGDKTKSDKPRRKIFRANKEQVTSAQNLLKERKLYEGEATGKLDDATRGALKKFQEANGIKATGTLNIETLQAMNIELTEKQKTDFLTPVDKSTDPK